MAKYPFQDPGLALEERVKDLLARLSLEEKVSQMAHESKAIPRLEIPAYNWWNEGLHGVGRAGVATVFPQAIGLAATFDPDLVHRIAVATSDEARAIAASTRGSHSGVRMSIFSATRAGAGVRKPTGRTPA
jgi:beta-glucosidase